MDELTIDEIIAAANSPADAINKLKSGRDRPKPDIQKLKEQYYPEHHKVFDRVYLPNRKVNTGITDDNGKPILRDQDVNRLAFPFQQQIVSKAVSFCFGNPINLNSEPQNEQEQKVLKALKRFGHDCKIVSFNRKMGREMFRATEVAEIWHVLPYKRSNLSETHNSYGFTTKWKVRVALLKPWDGDELYPYFDATGDMIAFSREYKRMDSDNKEKVYFETYTEDKIYRWEKDGTGWNESNKPIANPIGKIPVVYGAQDEAEWVNVTWTIERLEYLLSKFAETNDYHASPKIFVTGEIKSFISKGESGGVIQGGDGAKAEYLSWDNAPAAVKLEIETLLRFIYSFTQTPDVSFDSVKGLSQISGEALKMLFLDAHLKVEEKREELDMYMQRRVNIQKAIIASLAPDLKKAAENIEIEPEIIPYIINDDSTKIANIMAATGGKRIMSRRTGVAQLGWVNDIEEELRLIEEEDEKEKSGVAFEL